MPKITFIEHSGTKHTVDAEVGKSVMHAALDNNVPGILADCGGLCACATCHGYLDDEWMRRIPSKRGDEEELLGSVPQPREGSRLMCQILVRPELDGMIVRLPEAQF